MDRTRAQMIQAGVPNRLWGEFVMATSHILNLSPTKSVNNLPVNLWTAARAGSGSHQADISFLRVLGCQEFTHLSKSQRRKLALVSVPLIHVGYETGAKAYRLWSPDSGRIVISRDVIFDEATFPMRNSSREHIPNSDGDDLDNGAMFNTYPSEAAPAHPHTSSSEVVQPTIPATSTRPTHSTCAPTRYGNVVSYSAATFRAADPDKPTYCQEMSGPDKDEWRKAMEDESNSLVSHSVGRLIP